MSFKVGSNAIDNFAYFNLSIFIILIMVIIGFGYQGAYTSPVEDIKLRKELRKNNIKHYKYLIPICFIFTMISFLIPSTKQMAAIIIVPKIVNNQQVREIPSKFMELATEWMEEMSPKNRNERN